MRNLLFIIIGIGLLSAGTDSKTSLSPQEFYTQINTPTNKIVLDVRTKEEFNSGHIDRAINIDWNEATFESLTEKLDKKTPVYIYCLSGGRSSFAAKSLRERGFIKVIELSGGTLAWKKNKLKLTSHGTDLLTNMTKNEFETLYKGNPKKVLVDFYADWCGPCKKMKPILDELEKSNPNLQIIRINADKYSSLCGELEVNALPTFMLFHKDKLVWKKLGYIEKSELINFIGK
jgi:thioredoxin 1